LNRLWRAKYEMFRGNETFPAGSLILYDDETSSRRVFSSEEECDLYLAAAGLRRNGTARFVPGAYNQGMAMFFFEELFFEEYRLVEETA
jgi:hypothetical protein